MTARSRATSARLSRCILSLAFEVEFANPDGSTRPLLMLMSSQVRRLDATAVLTTRPLAIAA